MDTFWLLGQVPRGSSLKNADLRSYQGVSCGGGGGGSEGGRVSFYDEDEDDDDDEISATDDEARLKRRKEIFPSSFDENDGDANDNPADDEKGDDDKGDEYPDNINESIPMTTVVRTGSDLPNKKEEGVNARRLGGGAKEPYSGNRDEEKENRDKDKVGDGSKDRDRETTERKNQDETGSEAQIDERMKEFSLDGPFLTSTPVPGEQQQQQNGELGKLSNQQNHNNQQDEQVYEEEKVGSSFDKKVLRGIRYEMEREIRRGGMRASNDPSVWSKARVGAGDGARDGATIGQCLESKARDGARDGDGATIGQCLDSKARDGATVGQSGGSKAKVGAMIDLISENDAAKTKKARLSKIPRLQRPYKTRQKRQQPQKQQQQQQQKRPQSTKKRQRTRPLSAFESQSQSEARTRKLVQQHDDRIRKEQVAMLQMPKQTLLTESSTGYSSLLKVLHWNVDGGSETDRIGRFTGNVLRLHVAFIN